MGCPFRVGQRVVCIKRGKWRNWAGWQETAQVPLYGEVYTISHIWDIFSDHIAGLQFVEIPETQPMRSFCSTRFRPVTTRTTDIDVFKAIRDGHQKPLAVSPVKPRKVERVP